MKVENERRQFGRSVPLILIDNATIDAKLLDARSEKLDRPKLGFVFFKFFLIFSLFFNSISLLLSCINN